MITYCENVQYSRYSRYHMNDVLDQSVRSDGLCLDYGDYPYYGIILESGGHLFASAAKHNITKEITQLILFDNQSHIPFLNKDFI